MSSILRSSFVGLTAALALGLANAPDRAQARNLFDANEISNPEDFALIAAPVGQTNRRQLLIVEQLASSRACWGETSGTPTEIQPLLLSFNFSGICGRMSDSNAYSVRVAGEDLGLQYALRVHERAEGAVLVAVPVGFNRNLPELEIGRTYGSADGFVKLYLDPAWRLARRSYQGRTLGHVYLMSDYSIDELDAMAAGMSAPATTQEPIEPIDLEAPLDVPLWGEPSDSLMQP